MSHSSVVVTTFLAAAVEVIEMVIIVVGVGSVRGWRSTWLGAGAGAGVLVVLVGAFGTALQVVPIGALRLLIGSLLLVFGLQWLRKGIGRVREVAFIVVSFGLAAQALGSAVLGAAAALLVIAGAGLLVRGVVQRIPRSALQLLVGTLLSSFGTFWAVQGLGVGWPGGDRAILVLVGWYVLAAAGDVGLLRRRGRRLLAHQEASR